MEATERRLIEDYLPVPEVSYEATREKVVRRRDRHISMLHLWWARRPLAAARAAVYATLVPAPASLDREALNAFFKTLCRWSEQIGNLDQARRQILEAAGGRPPKILDPFAGGGAIPLEALRLGCEATALELNPVAYLIELCTLVYPQRFGRRLSEEVERWGTRVIERVRAEVGDLYPRIPEPGARGRARRPARQLDWQREDAEPDGLIPIAYLWTRTVPCPNPAQRPHVVPLVRQTWLVRKTKRYVALRVVPDRQAMQVRFEVVNAASEGGLGFDPAAFSRRGDATCPLCGTAVQADYVKAQGKAGRMGRQLMALVAWHAGGRGKQYLPPDPRLVPDESEILRRLEKLGAETGLTPPEEPIPDKNTKDIFVALYGLTRFRDLFTPRQLLTLLTFVKHIRRAHEEMLSGGLEPDLARAVATYLALILDRVVDRGSTLCRWNNVAEKTENTYARQALPMVWDFSETNPFGGSSGDAAEFLRHTLLVIDHCAAAGQPARVDRGSATRLPYPEAAFDAVVTDPPYYDNISYADLSDFFYVWLKRSVGHLYPEHFATDLTPKRAEIVAVPYRHDDDREQARRAYETLMEEALRECRRVLRSGGPLVAVYAHKTTAGWATLIKALRRAGFVVTEAWPLDTEMPDRVGQMETAHLASSIFIVARRREGEAAGDYLRQVRPRLQEIVTERVRTLFGLGISGSDLVIATVGAGLRAYTEFARVELPNGEELDEETYLDEVQREVLEVILAQVMGVDRAGVGGVDRPTRFYVLARYEYGEATVDFGEANILAKGIGVELDGPGGLAERPAPLVRKAKDTVTLLDYAVRGADEALGLPRDGAASRLIDVLHRLLWLVDREPGKVGEFLAAARPDGEQLRLVAQALAGQPLGRPSGRSQAPATRTREQQALDRLLAAWRHVVGDTLFTRGERG